MPRSGGVGEGWRLGVLGVGGGWGPVGLFVAGLVVRWCARWRWTRARMVLCWLQ